MEKKLVILLLFVALFINIISADIKFVDSTDSEDIKNNGILCLKNKINDSCNSLNLEEQIFSLLTLGECKEEVQNASKNDECWPKSGCDIKTTAQAILALDSRGVDTSKAEEWLISQNATPTNLEWYLQIEITGADSGACTINYDGSNYSINIGENKKIDKTAGECLELSDGNWWLKIDESCYDETFEISCDESFLTTLLFKDGDSSTIHVIENTKSASANGKTQEEINSFCFAKGTSCDYEGSLWAASILLDRGYEVNSFIPYLTVGKEDNLKYLPEAFLYLLTGETQLQNELLGKQKNGYWSASGDEFYDSAVALLPFTTDFTQKDKTIEWLTEAQIKSGDNQGCWNNGNLIDTAFLLYSVWNVEDDDTSNNGNGNYLVDNDCEDQGYYCILSVECMDAGGEPLNNYLCDGGLSVVCCSKNKINENTCIDKSGEICESYETCSGETIPTSDLSTGQTCCINGKCEYANEDECKDDFDCPSGEICEDGKCVEEENNEKECLSDSTCVTLHGEGYICNDDGICVKKANYLWVWILLILIVLVLIGILFKDKLIELFDKFGFGGGKKPNRPGFGQPPIGRFPPPGPMPPRPMPYIRSNPPMMKKGFDETDEVLKKLKEMGK